LCVTNIVSLENLQAWGRKDNSVEKFANPLSNILGH
jgi:hypothetical protein